MDTFANSRARAITRVTRAHDETEALLLRARGSLAGIEKIVGGTGEIRIYAVPRVFVVRLAPVRTSVAIIYHRYSILHYAARPRFSQ